MLKVEEVIEALEKSSHKEISFDQSFTYAKFTTKLLETNNSSGCKIIINVLNNWKKIPVSTRELWADIIESAGFYPYLEKNKNSIILNNLSAEIRKELHHSKHLKSKYFHEEQLNLLKLINSNQNLIVSAPTSFGKSLLIEEIIASLKYHNIIVIQPTLALLEETRVKLQKYTSYYKLIVRTSQRPDINKRNIFLFTAERVNEYQFFDYIDFLVIDEFYKLSGKRDDERASFLNNAFYNILELYNPMFYLLGPNIDGISKGFCERYNAFFYKSNYSLVDTKVIDIYNEHKDKFGTAGKKKKYKESTLFDLLYTLRNEQTIIYCSSPNRARALSNGFYEYLKQKQIDKVFINCPLIEWINENISPDWSLIRCLEYQIGVHDGALPKHITSSIINYFNKKSLFYLFCTSTIIEGVNTSAKNIIFYDSVKGGKDIDFFDYSNIKGRAGRLMEHYVGKIYNFSQPPKQENVIIDIPFFQQNPLKDETLIQLKEEHILNKETEQYKIINKIPQAEKDILKRNGISVQGQIKILSILEKDILKIHSLVNWSEYPSYEQLKYIISLAWENLIQVGETVRPMTLPQLVYLTFNYTKNKDISKLINDTYSYKLKINKYTTIDIAIQEVFQILKHWFQYKIPKWLSVINSLQEFVCKQKGLEYGSYLFYANVLENDFINESLAILLEYGIPNSAIKKIEKLLPKNIQEDDILEYIREKKIHLDTRLIAYEQEKISENL